jgi:hypothetical protein
VARYPQVDVALADEGRYVGRWEEDAVAIYVICGAERASEETYSAMWWFCTRQTSSRFGRLNWMSAPGRRGARGALDDGGIALNEDHAPRRSSRHLS